MRIVIDLISGRLQIGLQISSPKMENLRESLLVPNCASHLDTMTDSGLYGLEAADEDPLRLVYCHFDLFSCAKWIPVETTPSRHLPLRKFPCPSKPTESLPHAFSVMLGNPILPICGIGKKL